MLHQNLGQPAAAILGKRLLTEEYHPATVGLSMLAKSNLVKALTSLKQVDLEMLNQLKNYRTEILTLQAKVQKTLQAGYKIFISGCGAAGRAGVLAVNEFTKVYPDLKNQAVAILAGGEVALVRSVEGAEDDPILGQHQLIKAGWSPCDLLICLSASGSARFLHGQLKMAADAQGQQPYFHVCNPLIEVKEKFNYSKVHYLATPVGPMALAGSTRMQAATVQMLLMGIILLNLDFDVCISSLYQALNQIDLSPLGYLVEKESHAYQKQEGVYWIVSPDIALTVFTDKTELSPTFTLPYIEKDSEPNAAQASQIRVIVAGAKTNAAAFEIILGHAVNDSNLLEYDLSEQIQDKRKTYLPQMLHHFIKANFRQGIFTLTFDEDHIVNFELNSLPSLLQQILIKIILNDASTLVAGRLDRYYSNLMTYVVPANVKLVDRAMGLVSDLLQQESKEVSLLLKQDPEIVIELIKAACYEAMERHDFPIVLNAKKNVLAKLYI